jgi:hypothetical protein
LCYPYLIPLIWPVFLFSPTPSGGSRLLSSASPVDMHIGESICLPVANIHALTTPQRYNPMAVSTPFTKVVQHESPSIELPTVRTGLPANGIQDSYAKPFRARASRIIGKATTHDGWFGDYDYAWYVDSVQFVNIFLTILSGYVHLRFHFRKPNLVSHPFML